MTKIRALAIIIVVAASCSGPAPPAPAQQQPLTTISFPPYINTLPVAGSLVGSEPMLVIQNGAAFQASVTAVRGASGGASGSLSGNNAWTGIQTFAGLRVAVRSTSLATVTLATSDYLLCLDPTTNAITVNLPSGPVTGQTYVVKDCTGQAAAHNITLTPASGNIDGSATFVMTVPYQSAGVTYTGAQWSLN